MGHGSQKYDFYCEIAQFICLKSVIGKYIRKRTVQYRGTSPVRTQEQRRPRATTSAPLCQRFLDSSAKLTCEGLCRAKKTLPHFTAEKTEARVIGQKHTALQIEQEMGWGEGGPLSLESVLH